MYLKANSLQLLLSDCCEIRVHRTCLVSKPYLLQCP